MQNTTLKKNINNSIPAVLNNLLHLFLVFARNCVIEVGIYHFGPNPSSTTV